jgi:hypothetical protein
MIISDACTANIIKSVNDASTIVIDDSRVTLQIVASLTDNSRGDITDVIFIVQGTGEYHSLQDKPLLSIAYK